MIRQHPKKPKYKYKAVHLLGDVKNRSVKNYINDLMHRYSIRKPDIKFHCILCSCSVLNGWVEFQEHICNPSHLQRIKNESKQYTAICIFCKYIIMAEDCNIIFDHFDQHEKAQNTTDPLTFNTPISSVSPNQFESDKLTFFPDTIGDVNIETLNALCAHQADRFQQTSAPTTVRAKLNIKPSEYTSPTEEESTKGSSKNCLMNLHRNVNNSVFYSLNVKHASLSDSEKHSHESDNPNIQKSVSDSHNPNEPYPFKFYVNSAFRTKPTRIEESEISQLKCSQNMTSTYDNNKDNINSISISKVKSLKGKKQFNENKQQNKDLTYSTKKVTEKYNCDESILGRTNFNPEHVHFSSTAFQLNNAGVENDVFTIEEFNAYNIDKYCEETYYSIYHSLRKLYFSCLQCNSRKLQKDIFYFHINDKKHNLNIEKCKDVDFYIKICDFCLTFMLGPIEKIKEHFVTFDHMKNEKFRKDMIKMQYDNNSGNLKLGWSGSLTPRCIDIFSTKNSLNDWIQSSLDEAKNVESGASILITSLEKDIKKTLQMAYCNLEVEFVGSRQYGLAKQHSDIDIHLHNMEEASVEDLEKHFSKVTDLFEVKQAIKDAKVPIIRLLHLATNLICDVNCSNPTGGYTSQLVKVYISLDPRIRWVVMAIREWGIANDISGSKKITSYGLTWLVLFFLMTPKIGIIPPVKTLLSLSEDTKSIYGWNYAFTRDISKIQQIHNPSSCRLNKYELLGKFFEYYSNLEMKKKVLFPHDGRIYARPLFANPQKAVCPGLHENTEDLEAMRIGGQIMLMDPFRLRDSSILKSVEENLADHFKLICEKTLDCGWWSKK